MAGLLGALAGMAPDLDVLIRSSTDPLLFLEYHRQFTHSLAFIPIGAALCTAILYPFVRKWCRAGEAYTTIPGVNPGGELLLRANGWRKVERVLVAIDQVEALGVPPTDACPDHWRHIHNRLAAADEPRPYTARRHAAWLARRSLDL